MGALSLAASEIGYRIGRRLVDTYAGPAAAPLSGRVCIACSFQG